MKRILSVLLAVLMVFSTTVMAAPVTVSTVETAQETTADDVAATGELQAVVGLKPGINMLTGTTDALTGENTTNAALESLATNLTGETSFTVGADPLNVNGQALKWHVPAGVGNYPSMHFAFGGTLSSLLGHNYIHFAFDYSKVVDGADTAESYTANNNFWIMNTTTSGGDIAKPVGAAHNAGWKNFTELLDMTKGGTTSTKDPTAFKLEAEVISTNTVPTSIYIDNFYAVPAYEFKFLSEDGSEVLKTEYKAFDESGNIITTYTPSAGLYGSYYVPAWSLSKGGSAVTTVNLENKNLVFYAINSAPAVSVKQEGTLGNAGDEAKLIPVVASAIKDDVNVAKADWTIENEEIATITTNKDGSATVTAVSEGKTTATVTIGDIVVEYEVEVVFPVNIDVEALLNIAELELNPADYTKLVIQLSDTTEGDIYMLAFMVDDGEEFSYEIVAESNETRDYVIDLTQLEGWVEGELLTMLLEAGDATVNSAKLYSTFEEGFNLEIVADSALLSTPGEEVVVSAEFSTDLTGVYTGGYTLSVEVENDVASCKAYDDGTALIRAKIGTGRVTVTATSEDDPEFSVSKVIYVNVDSSKYGMFFDFLEAETPADSHIKQCGGDEGHTAATIVDGVLHLDRPTTVDGNGGFEPYNTTISEDAAKKYLVVKADDCLTGLKFYYKWDSNPHAEANTVSLSSAGSVKSDNGDGTVTVVLPFANVPDTADKITGFMGTIDKQSTADIHYFYLTSEAPELKAIDAIAYTWDFKTNTFTGSQSQGLAQFNGETMWASQALAMINGAKVNVQANASTLADGTEIYRLQTEKGTHGSLSPKTYPSGLVLNDYPYFWFKYRSNGTATSNLYLMDADKGGSEGGYDNRVVSFPASEDWTTTVVYLPDLGYSASLNTTLTNIMFPFRGETVLTNILSDDEGYYIPKTGYEYSSQTWIEFDEITIANYNPLAEEDDSVPLNMAITLNASSTSITEDSGSVTVSAEVFANQDISTDAVVWSTTSGNIKLVENDDGTVTVTAISNGDATIIATAVEDSAFSSSINIAVSGQRNKIAAYDFSYLCIGNSYSNHGYNPNYSIWLPANEPSRGMAASKVELDYYHRVQYYLTNNLNGTMTSHIIAGSGLENSGETTATATTAEQVAANMRANDQFISIKNYLINNKPNVITVQLSENFQSSSTEIEENFYEVLYGMIDEYRPENSVVVCITPFGAGSRVNTIKKYAQKYGFYVADMSDINSYSKVPDKTSAEYNTYIEAPHPVTGEMTKFYRGDNGWKYNPYLAWAQYPGYDVYKTAGSPYLDDRAEFRTHPGDKGMDEIAKRVFEQCEVAVPVYLDAKYVYIPDTITITGDDAITELAGSVQLTAVVSPDDSSADVIWSVNDEKLATISEDGVVTAKVNGEVVVTAKSAYDETVYGTKTIQISGQHDVYSVVYKAGTTDEVTDLPAADDYATGDYTLSTLVPSRNGYKFLGWSLTEGGEVVTTVNVTKNTDVYAVWTLAEGWHFDEDGNDEGISFGGFNVVVKDGMGTVLSYDEGLSVSDSTLLLDSDNYCKLNTKMSVGTAEEDVQLVLEITTANGKYSYSADVTAVGEQAIYSFDISDVTGTITGFALKPTALECSADVDWIEFERCALNVDAEVDVVNVVDDYTVDAAGNTFTVATIAADADEVITLKNGTFVIGEILGGTVVTDGNLVYDGTLEGYVSFELPAKADEANVRYAEVDGVQFKIDADTFGLVVDEAKLVQIVEKTDDAAVTTVASNYYLVNADGSTELTSLANSVDNVNEVSLRVKDPVGVRFKAGILNAAKADVTVTEYGYVIALERDLVNAGASLTLDFERSVYGSAYIKADGTDVIYANDGTTTFFTGVLYGIPENSYGVKLVSKTFTKLTVDGTEYVVYGEPMVASAYQIAKSLENSEDLDAAAKAFVENVIDKAENGNDVGFDFGDL